jgi:hypothetical protein
MLTLWMPISLFACNLQILVHPEGQSSLWRQHITMGCSPLMTAQEVFPELFSNSTSTLAKRAGLP